MLSLYFDHYYFVRVHSSLRISPAIAAEVTNTLHDMEWIVALIDAWAPKPNRPENYKKRHSNRDTIGHAGRLTAAPAAVATSEWFEEFPVGRPADR